MHDTLMRDLGGHFEFEHLSEHVRRAKQATQHIPPLELLQLIDIAVAKSCGLNTISEIIGLGDRTSSNTRFLHFYLTDQLVEGYGQPKIARRFQLNLGTIHSALREIQTGEKGSLIKPIQELLAFIEDNATLSTQNFSSAAKTRWCNRSILPSPQRTPRDTSKPSPSKPDSDSSPRSELEHSFLLEQSALVRRALRGCSYKSVAGLADVLVESRRLTRRISKLDVAKAFTEPETVPEALEQVCLALGLKPDQVTHQLKGHSLKDAQPS